MPQLPIPRKPPPRAWWDWMRLHGYPGWLSHHNQSYEEFVRSLDEDHRSSIWVFYELIPSELGARMRSDPPSCTVDFQGAFVRWDLHPEIALHPGSGWEENGEGIRVGRMKWDSHGGAMIVTLVKHQAAMGGVFNPGINVPRLWYTAINRKRVESSAWRRGERASSLRIATVAITWVDMPCAAPSRWIGDKWADQSSPDWLSDATLASGVENFVGRFAKKVTIERFVLNPGPSEAPP